MYVCLCHGIRCRDVKDAAGQGACRAGDVFRHMACKPQCGRCLPTIRDMLQTGSGAGMRAHRQPATIGAASEM